MGNDYQITRNGFDARIVARGRSKVEALCSLVKGFAAFQLPPNEVVVSSGGTKRIRLGYLKEVYLPADLINDLIGAGSASGQIYTEVLNMDLSDGVLTAELSGVKRTPVTIPKCAVYIGSRFKEEGGLWSAEVEVVGQGGGI